MEFKHLSDPFEAAQADVLALVVFADGGRDATFKAVDKAVGGLLTARVDEARFQGRPGEQLLVHLGGALAARAVALLGAGPKAELDAARLRDLGADAVKLAGRIYAKTMAISLPTAGRVRDVAHATQLAAEGAQLATYRFDRYRAEESRRPSSVETVLIATSGKADRKAVTDGMKRGAAVATAVAAARDFINEPAETMTPAQLAEEARSIAKRHSSLSVKVLTEKECEKLGMGMLLAVGRGSQHEVRVIHITYKPSRKPQKRVALVGKGITFDSGGYSLKPSSAMADMKIDMSGAAAVITAMDAIATLGSKHEVHAIATCAENMVAGNAYRLGDILRSMSGKTVEINNTDAEGRLALGDAITYTRDKVQPDELFDFATLTGACLIALGNYTAGVMSHNDKLAEAWLAAAARAGEDMWRLPLNPRLKEQLKSPIADMKNSGGRPGGAITAGLFLSEFVGETPWVHVDIAGPASASKEAGATAEGGAGFAVATIAEYLTR
jgi:leucyl aminopeptidase